MNNLLSKKLVSAGGAMGSICYIAGLVAAGSLPVPIGIVFAALVAGIAALHLHTQGKIDAGNAAGKAEGEDAK